MTGDAIRVKRKELQLSMRKLAMMAGVKYIYIYNIETGKGFKTKKLKEKILKILGFENDLFCGH